MAAIQLSRSSASAAWKVCFWPWSLKINSLLPSLVISVTSLYNYALVQLLSVLPLNLSRPPTYQVDDTSRVGLVLSALGKEKKTLAGLAGPSSVGVSKAKLFILEVGGELLALDGLLGEPEVSLDKAEAPVIQSLVSVVLFFFSLSYIPPSLPKV